MNIGPLMVQDLSQLSLSVLVDQCGSQIREFKNDNFSTDSSSCLEIVRRAAGGNNAALGKLLEISEPIIRQKCPAQLQDKVDDVVQTTQRRLTHRLAKYNPPFRASTFAEYHTYLNLTIKSVVSNMIRDEKHEESLDGLTEGVGYEPQTPSPADFIERRILWEKILDQLSDPLERKAVEHRYGLGESVGEVVEALQIQSPSITKKAVYRLLEHALRRLKNNPTVQKLLEDLR